MDKHDIQKSDQQTDSAPQPKHTDPTKTKKTWMDPELKTILVVNTSDGSGADASIFAYS